jgi:hypothetical protein
MRSSNGGGADDGGEVLLDHEYKEVGVESVTSLLTPSIHDHDSRI